MAHLKSMITKQLYSKFKVSYFFNLCLLLSLSSCTSEDLEKVIIKKIKHESKIKKL